MPASNLKIYLHDGTQSFRIQLVGTLGKGDLGELSGCWRTAKSTIDGRPLVLDVTKLTSVDQAGAEWLIMMLRESARILDGHRVTDEIPARLGKSDTAPPESSPRLLKGRLRSFGHHAEAK